MAFKSAVYNIKGVKMYKTEDEGMFLRNNNIMGN